MRWCAASQSARAQWPVVRSASRGRARRGISRNGAAPREVTWHSAHSYSRRRSSAALLRGCHRCAAPLGKRNTDETQRRASPRELRFLEEKWRDRGMPAGQVRAAVVDCISKGVW
eukprot:scaffold229162_cov35-Tisochrysis_lutea.AAC.3